MTFEYQLLSAAEVMVKGLPSESIASCLAAMSLGFEPGLRSLPALAVSAYARVAILWTRLCSSA